ncbi:unnamed protein product [Ectocarpus sp. 12 AP-2014]
MHKRLGQFHRPCSTVKEHKLRSILEMLPSMMPPVVLSPLDEPHFVTTLVGQRPRCVAMNAPCRSVVIDSEQSSHGTYSSTSSTSEPGSNVRRATTAASVSYHFVVAAPSSNVWFSKPWLPRRCA